jgi:tetratricopeptide (TPR) repeat protein
MHKKQIVVIVVVFAIMGCLFFMPVKGLIKAKDDPGHNNTTASAAVQSRPINKVDVTIVSSAAKVLIGPALSAQINDAEQLLKKTTDEADRLNLQKKLAKLWDDVNQPGPAAFYYQDMAQRENKFDEWVNAGSRFNDAFKTSQDTAAQPSFVLNAIASYKNAVKLKPADLDAKTGLGIAYVNQTSLGITDADGGSPMQGIMLLLDVVKQDPQNRNANLSLGLFAMKSGQYAKAVQRFKTIIAQKAEVEPYFYLAESYKQLGQKKEAIDAYQKCKEMMPDPAFNQRIDEYIKELKN